ncbi:hypothetical protein [Marinobacterium aestuariivivens]|uniref:Glutamate--cysteine ligase n=1 Tax=Marinobacterium aestuariivivens TaxID=1698799 RepID=A0ABW2A1L9_9GAMM
MLHPPILPICNDGEDALAQVRDGAVPGLQELRLHHGTVWSWNRVIYDDAGDGHLRVEMRALPAGPTPCDMMANAALLVGLAEGLRDEIRELMPALPFPMLSHNFYRAAEHGINARLLWPSFSDRRLVELSATELVRNLLPLAQRGLERIGIAPAERDGYIELVRNRLERGRTGATWQLDQVARLSRRLSRQRALKTMLECYRANAGVNRPVAEWTDIR